MMNKPVVSSYIGSKNRLAELLKTLLWYIGIKTYIEPYGGMFGVGVQKPPHPVEIYNDINVKLCHLFKVLSNETTSKELMKRMFDTEFDKSYFEMARFKSNNMDKIDEDDIQKAVYIWVTLLMSMNGDMKAFKGIHKGNEAFAYKKLLVNKYALIDRLKNIQVYNMDGLELIKKFKYCEDAMILVDTPYIEINESNKVKRKELYEHDMLEIDKHEVFANEIYDSTCKMLVCTYKCEIYDKILCDQNGWNCYKLAEVYKSMAIGNMGRPKTKATEFVYLNYRIEDINNGKVDLYATAS